MGCFVFGLVFNSDNFTFADVALSAFFACYCVKYMDGEFLDKKNKEKSVTDSLQKYESHPMQKYLVRNQKKY